MNFTHNSDHKIISFCKIKYIIHKNVFYDHLSVGNCVSTMSENILYDYTHYKQLLDSALTCLEQKTKYLIYFI